MMKKAINKATEAAKRAAYIVGHFQAVAKMIEEGRYCIDVIKQIEAVEGSLKKLKRLMLENHLYGCVMETMRSDKRQQRVEAVKELLEVYKAENR